MAKPESNIIRVSMSALFCDSDLSAPSQSEVGISPFNCEEREQRKLTEVKINLLEQLLAGNSGEGVGDGQQRLEILLAQVGRYENPYFCGETGT